MWTLRVFHCPYAESWGYMVSFDGQQGATSGATEILRKERRDIGTAEEAFFRGTLAMLDAMRRHPQA